MDTDGSFLCNNISLSLFLQIAAVAVLLLAVITLFRVAVLTASEKKLSKTAESGNKKGASIMTKVLNKKSWFVIAMQFLSAVIILITGAAAGLYVMGAENITAGVITAVVSVALLACGVVLIGEIIPEKLVYKKSESIALKSAGIIRFFQIVFMPVSAVLEGIAGAVAGVFNQNLKISADDEAEEEIKLMVEEGEEKGYIPETEKEMINNVFQFNDIPVNKIMTHRTDVSAFSKDATLDEIVNTIVDDGYTRFPVYDGDLDNIIGILHTKAVVQLLVKKENKDFDINDYLIKPYFVPQSKKADELFDEMQKNKIHIAVVIDEYGGTSGIITMEDLIESILGNIQDEYDNEDEEIIAQGEDTFIALGNVDFFSVCKTVGLEFPEEDEETAEYESLAGFVTGMLDKIPATGDSFEFENFVFEIIDADDKKINKIKIKNIQDTQTEE